MVGREFMQPSHTPEPLLGAFSFSKWLMRILSRLGGPTPLPAIAAAAHILQRCAMGL